jgi:ferredoxin-type protein NapG
MTDAVSANAAEAEGARRLTASRRAFCVSVAGVVGLFALGGVSEAFAGETLLRPPGGQDENAFRARCIRCDRCRSICPRSCITIATLEQGLENVRTPRVDFRKEYCDFCGRCADVCPTAAIEAFDKEAFVSGARRIGVAVVDTDECLAWKTGGCQVCAGVCPYHAITLDDASRPVVDPTLCNGCGCCEFACPSASYRSYSGSGRHGINIEVVEDGA